MVVSVELSLLGGSLETLLIGGAAELRAGLEAVAAEAGAGGADATITSLAVDTATVLNTQLQDVGSGTSSASDLVTSAVAAGTFVNGSRIAVNASDPLLNRKGGTAADAQAVQPSEEPQRRLAHEMHPLPVMFRRRLQLPSGPVATPPAGANCTSFDIYQPGSSTVSIVTVTTQLVLPASYLAFVGGDQAAAGASLRARLLRLLSSTSVVARTMGSFIRLWANCTGIPTSVGGDMFVRVSATVVLPPPTPPPPSPSKAGETAGIIIGSVAAVALLTLLAVLWHARLAFSWQCCRRPATGTAMQVPPAANAAGVELAFDVPAWEHMRAEAERTVASIMAEKAQVDAQPAVAVAV